MAAEDRARHSATLLLQVALRLDLLASGGPIDADTVEQAVTAWLGAHR
ncbi:hypothetical protein WCD74_28200 [Actinomycetospora sp. OC33-EN08]|uniref:TetR family transcriptional regulator n=1 Tax=Actinomycetospora aurantiaca TaxID=3129233 RepID=A0ABU8MWI6_9PSEU